MLFVIMTVNYVATILFFSLLALEHPGFVFNENSTPLPEVALALISEGGMLPTQQFGWIWLGNSLVGGTGYFLSKVLIARLGTTIGRRTAFTLLASQASLAILIAFCSWLFLRLSVYLYNWSGNTETQQYLLSQTYEVIAHPDHFHRLVTFLLAAVAFSPCTIFLITFLTLFLASLAGDRVRRAVLRVIYLVSTDKKPILSQIGTLFGSISAIIAVIAKYVGSP